jgi:hypothetical protein
MRMKRNEGCAVPWTTGRAVFFGIHRNFFIRSVSMPEEDKGRRLPGLERVGLREGAPAWDGQTQRASVGVFLQKFDFQIHFQEIGEGD